MAPVRILLAVDDSEHSEEAVRMIRSRPWPAGSAVRVLSVVPSSIPPPPAPAWSATVGGYADFQEHQRSGAEALVRRFADSIRTADLPVEVVVTLGDPGDVIVQDAEQWSADLIVMGSRGNTGLKRWVLGSVAQHVASHAPCSVEVVRAKALR